MPDTYLKRKIYEEEEEGQFNFPFDSQYFANTTDDVIVEKFNENESIEEKQIVNIDNKFKVLNLHETGILFH